MSQWIILLSICTISSSLAFNRQLDEEWEEFKKVYKRNYKGNEEVSRRTTFEENVERIVKHNLEYDMGIHTYWLGINKFADMSDEEFLKIMKCVIHSHNETKTFSKTFLPPTDVKFPDTIDWRLQNLVSPVKDQGNCGSCYAFATVGAMEGQHAKATGEMVELSEQNLVDCTSRYGNFGCEGGFLDETYHYVIDNQGIDTEESYPYTAEEGPCRFKREHVGATITSYMSVENETEDVVKAVVATVGPIAVAMNAGLYTLRLYRGGVYSDPNCNLLGLNHAVLIIGYGIEDGQDYWLVKNSWGESWGMSGFFKIARNEDNMCGIATIGSFPIV